MRVVEMSDNELVSRFLSGDSLAIEMLLHRYKNKVFTYLIFCVENKNLAEDLFQDTFLHVIKSFQDGTYHNNGKLEYWIIRIAHNLVIDYYRKRKRLPISINDYCEKDLLNSLQYSEKSVEQMMISYQYFQGIRRLVDALPEHQKEIVLLRHYGGLSFKEISQQTHVSISTAVGRMRYAIINMRKIIRQYHLQLSMNYEV